MKTFICSFILLVSAASFGQVIDKNQEQSSGSLWVNGRNPLLDSIARREGDVITILISETSVATFAANTSASKKDSTTFASNVLNSLFGLLKVAPQTTANSTTGGTGTTNQNGTLRATVTGIVKHVLPNTNLVIEGTRTIVINKETQLFRLTGIIRTQDIKPNNTVLSESIAQAEIRMEGKGQIADRQRKGILTTILDWIF